MILRSGVAAHGVTLGVLRRPTVTPLRQPSVGAVVRDDAGRLLLVRRANDPGAGRWSLPGGRVEPGETDHDAVEREVAEETGLRVRAGALCGRVRRGDYDIADYACEVLGGVLCAGDDATAVLWADFETYRALPLVEGLADVLAAWGVLPRAVR